MNNYSTSQLDGTENEKFKVTITLFKGTPQEQSKSFVYQYYEDCTYWCTKKAFWEMDILVRNILVKPLIRFFDREFWFANGELNYEHCE